MNRKERMSTWVINKLPIQIRLNIEAGPRVKVRGQNSNGKQTDGAGQADSHDGKYCGGLPVARLQPPSCGRSFRRAHAIAFTTTPFRWH